MWRVDLYPISILYHLFLEHIISYGFLSSKLRARVFVFGGKMWLFQTRRWWNLAEITQLIFTTQDRWSVPSSMSWTSCRWKKPSRWNNINTHINTSNLYLNALHYHCIWIKGSYHLFHKMKVLTYKSYKKTILKYVLSLWLNCFNCKIELVKKD